MRLRPMLVTVAVVTAIAGSAFAQTDAKDSTGTKDKKGSSVQVMDFPDADKLVTSGGSAFGATIGAAHGPVRILLVRPRVSFVPEMYKSIENL